MPTRVAGERPSLAGGEQRLLGLAVAFFEPWRRTATVSGVRVAVRCLRPLPRTWR